MVKNSKPPFSPKKDENYDASVTPSIPRSKNAPEGNPQLFDFELLNFQSTPEFLI